MFTTLNSGLNLYIWHELYTWRSLLNLMQLYLSSWNFFLGVNGGFSLFIVLVFLQGPLNPKPRQLSYQIWLGSIIYTKNSKLFTNNKTMYIQFWEFNWVFKKYVIMFFDDFELRIKKYSIIRWHISYLIDNLNLGIQNIALLLILIVWQENLP